MPDYHSFFSHWSDRFNGVQMYGKAYQAVIIAVAHGFFEDGKGRETDTPYLLDTNGLAYYADSFVYGLGSANI